MRLSRGKVYLIARGQGQRRLSVKCSALFVAQDPTGPAPLAPPRVFLYTEARLRLASSSIQSHLELYQSRDTAINNITLHS